MSGKEQKTIIELTPQTHVRATQGDSIFFRIPEGDLYPSGLKRKLRLVRYNQYKEDLYNIAFSKGFKLPNQGLSVKFCIPMPKSWKPWQKELMNGKLHQSKPDIDNLMKALFDSLLSEDKRIGHINEISKIWVNKEEGWIELICGEAKFEETVLPRSMKSLLVVMKNKKLQKQVSKKAS